MKYPQYLILGCLIVLGIIVLGTALMENPIASDGGSGNNDTNHTRDGNDTVCTEVHYLKQCEENPLIVFNETACGEIQGCSWITGGNFCLGQYDDNSTWLNCTVVIPENDTHINDTNVTPPIVPPIVTEIPYSSHGGGSSYKPKINNTNVSNVPQTTANGTGNQQPVKQVDNTVGGNASGDGQDQESSFSKEIKDHKWFYIGGAIIVLIILAVWIINPSQTLSPDQHIKEVKE